MAVRKIEKQQSKTLRTVVLRHETPDGDHHYDWMIERPGPDRRPSGSPLATWRVPIPPWEWAASGSFMLTPLPDHRRVYLDYQGPISGGRGRVRRVDRGEVNVRAWSEESAKLIVRMSRFRGVMRLKELEAELWSGEAAPLL